MKSPKFFTLPLCAMASVSTVSAEVFYSDFQNIEIPTNFTGVYLNVLTGDTGTNDNSPPAGWHINPFFGGIGVMNSEGFQPLRQTAAGDGTLSNFGVGASISSGSTDFATLFGASDDHLGTTFTAGQEGYLGFSVDNNSSTNYGWMRVIFDGTGNASIKDWAYDTSGGAINVARITQSAPSAGTQQYTLSPGTGESFVLGSAMNNTNSNVNSVVMNGLGTVSLSAENTHTGSTTISSGTLNVVGSGSLNSSNVTIDGGTFRYNSSVAYSGTLDFTSGTLGGTNLTGSLGGLEIGADRALSPGNSTGTALTTSQTWAGGGSYLWEINNATGIAGSAGEAGGWDLLLGSGSLAITATSETPFTIAITSLGLNQVEGDAAGFNDLSSYNWLIADFDTAITNFAAAAFAIDTEGFSNLFTGTFGVARGDSILGGDGSQVYLTYTAIPEPRAALLGALGLAFLLCRRAPREERISFRKMPSR